MKQSYTVSLSYLNRGDLFEIKKRGHEIELRDNGELIVKGNCIWCGDRYAVILSLDHINDWLINNIPIKTSLKSLSQDQIDFIKTGISPKGWDMMQGSD